MRIALMLAGSIVCALVVWAAVGSSVGALIGAAGWWALVALAWPLLVGVGAYQYDKRN